MRGEVVELLGLVQDPSMNGKRGFITGQTGNRAHVNIEDKTVKVKPKNTYPVFCLGLPRPYWKTLETEDNSTFQDCIADFLGDKANSFVVRFESFTDSHGKMTQSAFMINSAFFGMALEKMRAQIPNVCPLLRVYAVDKTQEECNIVFGRQCLHIPSEVDKFAWFTDFSVTEFMRLVNGKSKS